jgi:hypothetical protein
MLERFTLIWLLTGVSMANHNIIQLYLVAIKTASINNTFANYEVLMLPIWAILA